jgi:hypothetical protein
MFAEEKVKKNIGALSEKKAIYTLLTCRLFRLDSRCYSELYASPEACGPVKI